MSIWIFLGSTKSKKGFIFLSHKHKAVALVRLDSAAPQSLVKHFTTETLRSLMILDIFSLHLFVKTSLLKFFIICGSLVVNKSCAVSTNHYLSSILVVSQNNFILMFCFIILAQIEILGILDCILICNLF